MKLIKFFVAHLSDLHLASSPNRYGLLHLPAQKYLSELVYSLSNLLNGKFAIVTGSYDERSIGPLAERLALGFNPERNSRHALVQDFYDAIVISGDIGTHGDLITQTSARGLLDKILDQSLIKASRPIISLVPGNHDRFQTLLNIPGSVNFDSESIFEPDWRPYPLVNNTLNALPYRKIQEFTVNKAGTSLSFISVDFCLRSSRDGGFGHGYLDRGFVYKDILEELITKTVALKASNIAVIWVVHFPPSANRNSQYLRHQNSLIQAAFDIGIELILCGHTHRSNNEKLYCKQNKTISVVVAGSVLAFGQSEPLSYREHLIEVNPETLAVKLTESVNVRRQTLFAEDFGEAYVYVRDSD